MFDAPRLLVVDDEAAICQACGRVFSRQGFQVDESTDAREGLSRAWERDYSAILLDIKMPDMDGIQFLERLREKKPDVPVMIMTGYPSIPNAASAIRLGASDYVTKPFTPEQITQSVRRMLARDTNGKDLTEAASPIVESWANQEGEFLFLDESWLHLEEDGSACLGAVLVRPPSAAAQAVLLPQIGDAVYQGLPLAGVTFSDESRTVIPSPVSGVVVSVNEQLISDPSNLWSEPCGKGWIGCICTTRLEEEIGRCKPRRLILANANETRAGSQAEQLTSLGCQVHSVMDWQQLAPVLQDSKYDVLMFDAPSFGMYGPELVRKVNAAVPSMKVVVFASSAPTWESAYRECTIFYYAVEPFADCEIVEILSAAFRWQRLPHREAVRRKVFSEPLHGIRITNRNGCEVQLLAGPGLLRRKDGLGGQIMQRLIEGAFPITIMPGSVEINPTEVLKTASICDRVMILLAKDTGRLPGSLVRDTKAEYVSGTRENAGRATTLAVQPDSTGFGFAGFDDRTTAALAEHIVQEMSSY